MTLSFVADCARCAGLCCVALPYQRSADFPESKPAGRPCRHLGSPEGPYACAIHAHLADRGWRGCVAFDCAGAGPHAVHTTYGGRGWASEPGGATPAWTPEQYAVFRALLGVFEVGRYLAEAQALVGPGGRAHDPALAQDPGLAHELAAAEREVELAAFRAAEALTTYDPAPLRALAGGLLRRTAAIARASSVRTRPPSALATDLSSRAPGADLAGRRLRGADLRGADLTGASLLGADLRGADLADACLLGADLRGCRLDGARLERALFLPARAHAAATDHRPGPDG